MKKLTLGLLALVTVASVGCGGGGGHEDHAASGSEGGDKGVVPGSPADPADADRKIEVTTTDALRFEPASLKVTVGEAVTFVVRNEGKTEHEFVLGDEAYQDEHGADMGEHSMMTMENAVTVSPGGTAKLTWRFDEAGEVLYGCHVSGHYEGGMVGTIRVS